MDLDLLNRMASEIVAGLEWGDPRSKVPQTPEHRRVWDNIAADVADMEARGIGVELPFEVPDLD